MILRFLIIIILLLFPLYTFAERTITLPFTLNFDDNSWTSDLALTECQGTSTHVTSGCYSGGCAKITPPTAPCTGGVGSNEGCISSGNPWYCCTGSQTGCDINGGATGLGWFNYSSTNTIHIRFLIKFGTSFASHVSDGGGGLINKFILLDAPTRLGILGLNGSDTDGRYLAFGALDSDEVYKFASEGRAWIEDAALKIKDASRSGEWIAVEYWVDTTNDRTGVYIWTLDGTFSGSYINVPSTNTQGSTGFWMSYYNSYGGTADTNNYYMIDNMVVSSSYIGPPDGFGTTSTISTILGSVLSGGTIR